MIVTLTPDKKNYSLKFKNVINTNTHLLQTLTIIIHLLVATYIQHYNITNIAKSWIKVKLHNYLELQDIYQPAGLTGADHIHK